MHGSTRSVDRESYVLAQRYAIAIAVEAQVQEAQAVQAQAVQAREAPRGYALALASWELVARTPAITAIRDSFLYATVVSLGIPVSACPACDLSCPTVQFSLAPCLQACNLACRGSGR